MPLSAPNLDDRRFQDGVDDAKHLVRRRVLAWTDHEVHDPGGIHQPGITQIETPLTHRGPRTEIVSANAAALAFPGNSVPEHCAATPLTAPSDRRLEDIARDHSVPLIETARVHRQPHTETVRPDPDDRRNLAFPAFPALPVYSMPEDCAAIPLTTPDPEHRRFRDIPRGRSVTRIETALTRRQPHTRVLGVGARPTPNAPAMLRTPVNCRSEATTTRATLSSQSSKSSRSQRAES